jgi:hypothetical protein
VAKKLNAFEKQFAAARASHAKEFSFGGKSYNTKLKGNQGTGGRRVGGTDFGLPASTPVVPGPGRGQKGGVVAGLDMSSSPKPETVPLPKPRSDAVTAKATSRPSFSGLSDVASNPAVAGIVPLPRSRDGALIQNQVDANRANPPQADPALVAKFTRTPTKVQTVQARVPDRAVRPNRETLKPLDEARDRVVGQEVNQTTAKTGRLKNTNMARTGPRLKKRTSVADNGQDHDFSALSFFK